MQSPTLYTKCQFDNPHMNLSQTLDKNTYNNKPECTFSHLICNHFSRKVVVEKWFCKIRVCTTTFLQPGKRWFYSINPPFFLRLQPEKKIRVCRTTFLPPSKSLLRVQIKRLTVNRRSETAFIIYFYVNEFFCVYTETAIQLFPHENIKKTLQQNCRNGEESQVTNNKGARFI